MCRVFFIYIYFLVEREKDIIKQIKQTFLNSCWIWSGALRIAMDFGGTRYE